MNEKRDAFLYTAAPVHPHVGQLPQDDVLVLVHVEHVHAGHLLGGAAGVAVGLLQEVGVGVGGHHDAEGAVAGAVVGLVLGRVDDPLPAELTLKVDGDGPQAAVGLGSVGLLRAHLYIEWPVKCKVYV